MPPQLYQFINKQHLDADNKLTDDEWELFVKKFQDDFAVQCSEIAVEMFDNFKEEQEKEKEKDDD